MKIKLTIFNSDTSQVWANYKNLEYFIKIQKLNKKQARWMLYLLKFNFTWKHISETQIKLAKD